MAAHRDVSSSESARDFAEEKNDSMRPDSGLDTQHDDHMSTLPTVQALPGSEALQTTASLASAKTSSNLMTARSALGLHPLAPIEEEHDYAGHSDLLWSKIRMSLKEPFAEFFGVFILVLIGDGSVAQVLLSTGQDTAPGGNGFGSYDNINWGWAIGVMLGIYVAGDSGAYLKLVLHLTHSSGSLANILSQSSYHLD